MLSSEKPFDEINYIEDKKVLDDRINECRKLLNDYSSSDELIKKRLDYLEALCRNIIKNEIKIYVSNPNKRKA